VGRKDKERFQRLRESNPGYVGYRGLDISTVPARSSEAETETVICAVCQRKRNVARGSLPMDVSTFVCLRCQENPT